MKMIKQDNVIEVIGNKMNLNKREVKELLGKVDEVFEAIHTSLEVDQYAKMGSFIVIEKKEKKGRTGVAPKTGVPYSTEDKIGISVKGSSKAKALEV